MSKGIKMRVWGERACFTRPEMKLERVSYDVITPSAARGVVEAVYWKPSIRWIVDRITVVSQIKTENIRRNELKSKISSSDIKSAMESNKPLYKDITSDRVQRASLILKDVDYIIEAHFEALDEDGENAGKHLDQFNRRLKAGNADTSLIWAVGSSQVFLSRPRMT